jgi:hypothetical protein
MTTALHLLAWLYIGLLALLMVLIGGLLVAMILGVANKRRANVPESQI